MAHFFRLIAGLLTIGAVGLPAYAAGTVGWVTLAETGCGLRPEAGEFQQAIANEPVAAGMALRTGPEREEFRVAGAVVALAPSTTLDILRVDDGEVRLGLRQGRIGLALDKEAAPSVAIETAHGIVTPSGTGRYDVDAESGLMGEDAAGDYFGAWWRSRAVDVALPTQLPANLPGAAALADYGTWKDTPDGPAWFPKDRAVDWAPYRAGNWAYLPPWGWTWIDDAPWGFAPSHYGRWARIDDAWAWFPDRDANAPYRPAVVAFLGTPGIGLSYAGGFGPAVGWFALAPGETYWPQDKGPAPIAIVDAPYANRRYASAVPRAVFLGGKPVATALVDIPERRLDSAPVVPGSPQIAPQSARPTVAVRGPEPPSKAFAVEVAAAASRVAAFRKAAVARFVHLTRPAPRRLVTVRSFRPALRNVPPPAHVAAAVRVDRTRRHLADAHRILRQ